MTQRTFLSIAHLVKKKKTIVAFWAANRLFQVQDMDSDCVKALHTESAYVYLHFSGAPPATMAVLVNRPRSEQEETHKSRVDEDVQLGENGCLPLCLTGGPGEDSTASAQSRNQVWSCVFARLCLCACACYGNVYHCWPLENAPAVVRFQLERRFCFSISYVLCSSALWVLISCFYVVCCFRWWLMLNAEAGFICCCLCILWLWVYSVLLRCIL